MTTSKTILSIIGALVVAGLVIGGDIYFSNNGFFDESQNKEWQEKSVETNVDKSQLEEQEKQKGNTTSPETQTEKSKKAEEYANCGSTDWGSDYSEYYIDFNKNNQIDQGTLQEIESNGALGCLGEKILKGCRKTEAVMKSKDGEITFSVEGESEAGLCKIRQEYGSKDEMQSEKLKKYANTYAEYTINIAELKKDVNRDIGEVEQHPATIGLLAYVEMMLKCSGGSKNCSGSYVEVSQESFNEGVNQDTDELENDAGERQTTSCDYGKEVGGGILASCDNQGNPDLIVMSEDISDGAEWGCDDKEVDADSESDGQHNTQQIIDNCNEEGFAARLCAESSENGYNDWYLPSEDEFSDMHHNLITDELANFVTESHYWSSTEFKYNAATWYKPTTMILSGGSEDKGSNARVRCVRSYSQD